MLTDAEKLTVAATPSALKRFSAHHFNGTDGFSFDPVKYSKFKFGCKDSAREFGLELAAKFINSLYFRIIKLTLLANKSRVVVMPSPYVHVPTATFAMKDYFVRSLNAALVSAGLLPVIEAKIYRKSSYKQEYGELNKTERFKVMADDSFYVDANLLRDNVCLFIDDIVITGAHEYRIFKMLEKSGLHKSNTNYFLYFAELVDENASPSIENYLNYYFVKDLFLLDKIIKNEPFIMNTRVIKYVLDADHNEALHFFKYQKPVFLQTFYHNAIGNGYHLIPDYQHNLNVLKTLI